MKKRKVVYICSRFKGDVRKNIRNAEDYSKMCIEQGNLPICVHLFLESASGLDERSGDRDALLYLGEEYLKICDECWVFTIDGNISAGMMSEINLAAELGIPIKRWKVSLNEETKRIKQEV